MGQRKKTPLFNREQREMMNSCIVPTMKRNISLVVCLLLLVAVTQAQDIRALSGGTGIATDPKDKKLIRLVAEDETKKLTLGRSLMKHKTARMIGIYLKVENRSDVPLRVEPSKFSMIDNEGQAFNGLDTQEAINRFNNSRGLTTAILVGPLMNPALQGATAEAIRRESLATGDIPPHSFKEGIIFFDAPKRQRYTVKVTLTDLWPQPFVFSTEKGMK